MTVPVVRSAVLDVVIPESVMSEERLYELLSPVFGAEIEPILYTQNGKVHGSFVFPANQPVERITLVINTQMSELYDALVFVALCDNDDGIATYFLRKRIAEDEVVRIDVEEFYETIQQSAKDSGNG